MKLTQKLIGYLNRVFERDPQSFLALRFRYAGTGMTWVVSDDILTVSVSGGAGAGFSIDLEDYTLSTLAAYISTLNGFTVLYIDPSRSGVSALALLEGCGDQAKSNGDHIYAYTSLLYAFMEAGARELSDARTQIQAMPSEMNIFNADGSPGAEGYWLDEIGSYYDVRRDSGEADELYGPRILAEVIRPRGNNVGLEIAIKQYTGQDAQVVDVVQYVSAPFMHNSAITHNAAHTYGVSVQPEYNLFDVAVGYDLLHGGDLAAFETAVRAVITRLRDAGTHLRAFALNSAVISDDFTAPAETMAAPTVGLAPADTFTAPTDAGYALAVLAMAFADTLETPSESSGLTVFYAINYDATRRHNGAVTYNGGAIPGTIEG